METRRYLCTSLSPLLTGFHELGNLENVTNVRIALGLKERNPLGQLIQDEASLLPADRQKKFVEAFAKKPPLVIDLLTKIIDRTGGFNTPLISRLLYSVSAITKEKGNMLAADHKRGLITLCEAIERANEILSRYTILYVEILSSFGLLAQDSILGSSVIHYAETIYHQIRLLMIQEQLYRHGLKVSQLDLLDIEPEDKQKILEEFHLRIQHEYREWKRIKRANTSLSVQNRKLKLKKR